MNISSLNLPVSYLCSNNKEKIIEHLQIGYIWGTFEDLLMHKELYLHNKELKCFDHYKFPLKRRNFLLGRYAAKNALMSYHGNPSIKATDFFIENGIDGEPILLGSYHNISISHSGPIGIALISPPSIQNGIDLEHVSNLQQIDEKWFLESEIALFKLFNLSSDCIRCLIWSAKESLVKYLKTGFSIEFNILQIEKCELDNNIIIIYFTNFKSIRCFSFVHSDIVLSISLNKNIALQINTNILNYIHD